MEETVGGYFGVIDQNLECKWSSNPTVNMPDGVITSAIRRITLPDKSNFGSIEKNLLDQQEDEYYGEAVYLKSDISLSGCSSIPANGDYSNILGTLTSGEQGWYAGHVELDENTIENPITDAGAAMATIANLQGLSKESDLRRALCPVAAKSFLNSKFEVYISLFFLNLHHILIMKLLSVAVDNCYMSTSTNACSSSYLKQNDGDAVLVCGSPGEKGNNPLTRNTFSNFRCKFISTFNFFHFMSRLIVLVFSIVLK